MKNYIFKFLIISLLILSITDVVNAQKLTSKQRVAKVEAEQVLLYGYAAKTWKEKMLSLEGVSRLWFDTTKFNVVISRNETEEPDKMPFQAIGHVRPKDENIFRNDRLILFDQSNGKITKVIDLAKNGPNSKSKLPLLDEVDYYDMERISVLMKKDGKADRSLIKRYITHDYAAVDQDGYVVCMFYKLGVTKTKPKVIGENKWYEKDGIRMNEQIRPSKLIDKWTTCIIYDHTGKEIFNTGELNYNVWMHELRHDRKYLILNTGKVEDINEMSNVWDGDGFTVFDIPSKKEIYRYTLPTSDKERSMEGAAFETYADEPNDLIIANFTLPNTKEGYGEQWVMDFKTRVKYCFRFDRKQRTDKSNNWESKYKSFLNIVKNHLFEYKTEKF